jgi:hypothetical protein
MESTVSRHRDNSTVECDFEGLKVEAMRKNGRHSRVARGGCTGQETIRQTVSMRSQTRVTARIVVLSKSNQPEDLITTAVRFEKGRRIQRELLFIT